MNMGLRENHSQGFGNLGRTWKIERGQARDQQGACASIDTALEAVKREKVGVATCSNGVATPTIFREK
jgi:hypothetical protein